MPGISPRLISDKLGIDHNKRPIRQKRRAYDPEKYEAMKNEVEKLHSIDFIKEVDYPSWLANVTILTSTVLATRIAFLSPASTSLLTQSQAMNPSDFVDAYLRYNQIFMHPKDQAHVGPSQISRPGAPGRGDARQHVTSFFWMRCGCARA
ncbi:unnamed protein product [Prunus armeniaca]